ncbi:MAG: carbon-nitrogen hydrolase family protein [Chloroflexi bacterium]|nr:carbon-nitrogen hydrolase family protein [Chloroflexota bacterium]
MSTRRSRLRVAAAQMSVSRDRAANLAAIEHALEREASRGVELVVFPEAALSGYAVNLGHPRPADEWPALLSALESVADAAHRLGLWVALGCDALESERWVNRVYVYSPSGELAASYDKVHLTHSDALYYDPGHDVALFDLDGVSIGLQICYDVRFPEGCRALLEEGVRVVLHPFCAVGGETWKVPVLGAHLRSRAAENGMYVVAANAAGPLQMVVSQIISPDGLVLAEANQDHVEIIEADLDLDHVQHMGIRDDYLCKYRALS